MKRMKSLRKNSKKLSWQHPEIPSIQEDEVLKTSLRGISDLDYGDHHGEGYEGVHHKGDLQGMIPDLVVITRDRSCSLPTVRGRYRLSRCFNR